MSTVDPTLLRRAADYLHEHGWTRSSFVEVDLPDVGLVCDVCDYERAQEVLARAHAEPDCAVCLMGAVIAASYELGRGPVLPDWQRLHEDVGTAARKAGRMDNAVEFNDRYATTKDEAVQYLHDAARALEVAA